MSRPSSLPPRLSLALVALVTVAACTDDAGDDAEAGETASDEVGDSSSEGGSGSEGEEGTEPFCGDGNIDPGEECDDGNTVEGDGCSASCIVTACGMRWSVQEATTTSLVQALDVAVADDGSLYLIGRDEGPDDFDIWVAHYDQDGAIWETTFDYGVGNDAGLAITIGPGGQLFAGGRAKADEDAMWWASLSPTDGSENWSEVMDGPNPGDDDRVSDVAISEGGEVLLVGEVGTDNGSDVWLSMREVGTGEELWTTTWSGEGDGNNSPDLSGPMAVAPNGDVWVGAREFVDFNSQDAALLRFDGAGNLLEEFVPLGGGNHQHNPVALLATEDAVYYAIESDSGAVYRSWLVRLDAEGNEVWTRDEAYWADHEGETIGSDWGARSLGQASNGDVIVMGDMLGGDDFEMLYYGEAWVARLDAAGDYVCRGRYRVDDGLIIPPSLAITGAGSGASGAAGLSGVLSAGQGPNTWRWTGYFLE